MASVLLHRSIIAAWACAFFQSTFAFNAFHLYGEVVRKRSTKLASFAPRPPRLSSNLISQLAILAIQSRLQQYTEVTCDLPIPSPDKLLQGRVGPVTVSGKDWTSPSGQLTCRAIEATVDACTLDIGQILSTRKLILTVPATGMCMVALKSEDFGNFITHPRLRKLEGVTFLRENATVDATQKWVEFRVRYQGEDYVCQLQRSEDARRRGTVTARLETSGPEAELNAELSDALGNFFNNLIFELDGTFLTFRDMMISGVGPNLMLSLQITVEKFPSPGVDF